MCGIAGFAAPDVTVGDWFADAINCVRHRGPDRQSVWLHGDAARRPLEELAGTEQVADAALGFARLAIIDLSEASDQPLLEPGRATLAFNGEIYNYVELRAELETLGWQFHTSGDGEVLLKGYLQWGTDVLQRLNGMFALAIHDEARRSLLLARDRFGEKPLFWTRWRGGIAFASEVKQLATFPGLTVQLDPGAVQPYLETGRPYHGFSSWFSGIEQLPPGSWLEWRAGDCRTGRYFDLRADVAAVERPGSPGAWAERFGSVWQRAVEIRLRSDVPVGTSLSSGLDSSAVLAEAAALGHERYHAFTLRYDDARDEGADASAFADWAGATWHPVWGTDTEFAATWDQLTWHHEAPVPTASAFGQWKVFGAASAAGVRVVLDGQGSDEMLGGYHKFYAAHVKAQVRRIGPGAALEIARFARQVGIRPLAQQLVARAMPTRRGGGQPLPWRHDGPTSPPILNDLLEMRIADIETWSLPNLLAYADRDSMAHGVETRLPFLDPEVAAVALAMPPSVLFRHGWTKWPLRVQLARRGATEPAWRRGKRWFDLPYHGWFATSLRPFVDQLIGDPHPAWAEFVDVDLLGRWVARNTRVNGRSTVPAQELLRILALERFFRVWLPAAA